MIYYHAEHGRCNERILRVRYKQDQNNLSDGWMILSMTYPSGYNQKYNYAIDRGTVVEGNTARIDWEIVPKSVEDLQNIRCKEVDALRVEKLYTDVTATFPDGDKEIQFRDEYDRSNLANVTQAAMAAVMSGAPETVINYRTKDNVTQVLSAAEMMSIGNMVMAEKQNIVEVCWTHKDTIRNMTDAETIIAYDINLNW